MRRVLDPFREFDRLFDQVGAFGVARGGTMPMDAFRREDVYELRFDLPGVHPENISLEVEDQTLTIEATRAWEDTEGVAWLSRERPHGTHSRQIRLGSALDAGAVEANYDQGVLTVTIPVKAEAKPRKVSIEVGEKQPVLEASAS